MASGRPFLPSVVVALTVALAPAKAETIRVTIDTLVFAPVEMRAKAGDRVEWVNKDPFAHTATVKGEWEVMIPPGKSASAVMKKTGTFDYFCRFHPNMTGRITVSAD